MRGFLVVVVGALSGVVLKADCRTPIGIPCHTIEYKTQQTTFFHRGLTDFGKISLRSIHAVGEDGSSYHEEAADDAIGRSAKRQTVWIYNASSDRIVVASPQQRTFYIRTPTMWHDRPFRVSKNGDETCSSGILHNGTDFRLVGSEKILGVSTAHWYRELGNGGYEDAWLAPDLDCAGIRHIQVLKNWLHLPTFTTETQASRIDTALPNPTLFNLPTDYREVATPARIRSPNL
jgi:hypothetical protein